MTQEEFSKQVEERIEKLKALLLVIGKEYIRNSDPIHNFNQGAKITGENPAQLLDGFLMKHYISYRDMLCDLKEGKILTYEKVDEKIGDIITYFVIQEIILKEHSYKLSEGF